MDKYWNDSPHKYVANVKTPTIFLIGEKGRRLWPQQAVRMYRALHNGVPTRVQPARASRMAGTSSATSSSRSNAELEPFAKYATRVFMNVRRAWRPLVERRGAHDTSKNRQNEQFS